MAFLSTCPQCKQNLKVGDDARGKKIKCLNCGNVFAARSRTPQATPEEQEPTAVKAAATRCTCPSCQTVMKLAAPVSAGKRIKCPRCATVFPVLAEEAPAPAHSRTEVATDDEDAAPRGQDRKTRTRRRRAPEEEDGIDNAEPDDDEESAVRSPRGRQGGTGKERKVSLALRVSALILGVIGGLFAGGLGLAWLAQASSPEVKTMRAFAATVAGKTGSRELEENLARFDRLVRSAYFLLLAAPLGIVGGVLALRGRVKLGGGLMLAAVPVPLILNLVTLMPLYFLLFGGTLALLTRPWPPKGGPSRTAMAWMTAGGWILVFVGWVLVILALPKAVPELNAAQGPTGTPPVKHGSPVPGTRGAPGVPGGPSGGQPSHGQRIEILLGLGGYPEVTKQGVKVGQTIKVKGDLSVADDGQVSLNLAQLYDGPEPAVSAVELTRAATANREAAAKKYKRPDASTIVEGVVAELRPEMFCLFLEGVRK